ncbi:MAG: DNA polymerase/3'-5' exonuclease PolX [Balneolaceae bacterium]
MNNSDIAAKLKETGELMQLAGENRFRAAAFDRAARTIENLSEPVSHYLEEGNLTSLDGIGASIAEDIEALCNTGTAPILEELKKRVPKGLVRWLDISGLGPKNAAKIHKELGISTLEELRNACESGSVEALSGLGKKSAEKILSSIRWLEEHGSRNRLDRALGAANSMKQFVQEMDGVRECEVAGSLRRWRETIGDIDILVSAGDADREGILEKFARHSEVDEVLGRGETKCSVRVKSGSQIDLRVVREREFAAALLYFTGSKEHNVRLRQLARQKGMLLNEYGLFTRDEEGEPAERQEVKGEEGIYQKLDMLWVPPELREDLGEVEIFKCESLSLIESDEVKGVIHAHSNWSDGRESIESMARACMERGYEYLGLSDHSRSAVYANGLTEDRVRKQWEEVDRMNEMFEAEGNTFKIFRGIESDILPDGSLDYSDELLEGFDFVIASVHSSLDMPEKKMTNRILKAIEHPATRILGHPTGRLLLRRKESQVEMSRLIEAAAANQIAIEINANPNRLDLDWRYGEKAREAGMMTSINPDAHNAEGIDDIQFGVAMARKARFGRDRVINTFSVEKISSWFRRSEQ